MNKTKLRRNLRALARRYAHMMKIPLWQAMACVCATYKRSKTDAKLKVELEKEFKFYEKVEA